MSSLNVLVIDDSSDFGEGLKRLIESLGHQVHLCEQPDKAKTLVNQNRYDLILIDCFMPNIDGFSLSSELFKITKQNGSATKFILMSGILVDEASKKEAHSHDHVSDFLVKPISKHKLEETLETHFEQTKNSILNELLSQNSTENDISAALSTCSSIKGVELSYIIPLISEMGLSCKLNVLDQTTQNTYSISFQEGLLSNIFSSEYNNSLGELLVGLGYLIREDLSSYINSEDFKNSTIPIGLALTQKNLISPHAVPVALKQQNINRLNDILSIKKMVCSLESSSSTKKSDSSSHLNQYDIQKECRIWVEQSITDEDVTVLKNLFSAVHFKKSVTLMEHDPSFEKISDLLSIEPEKLSDKNDLIFLFSNLVGGELQPAEDYDPDSSLEKKSLLAKVHSLKLRVKQNDPYTLLGVEPEGISDQKISKKYQVYAKDLHPDKIQSILSQEELEEAQEVFIKITEAFNLIKTEDNRTTFESFKRNKSTQLKLQCNNNLEAAKTLLFKGEYTKAFHLLNTEEMHSNYPNEFGLYFLWAALKSKDATGVSSQAPILFEREKKTLNDESLYYYVKSLEALKAENLELFQDFIKKSLQANSQFLPARRELQIAKSHLRSKNKKTSKSWFSFKKSS